MISPILPPLATSMTFHLKPCRARIGYQRMWAALGLVLIPVLLFHGVSYDLLDMDGPSYQMAFFTFLLLCLAAFGLYSRKQKPALPIELKIDEDEVRVFQEGTCIHQIAKQDLVLENIGWGDEDRQLPALSIRGSGFPKMTIGASYACTGWQNMNKSILFPDYLHESEEEWKAFLSKIIS